MFGVDTTRYPEAVYGWGNRLVDRMERRTNGRWPEGCMNEYGDPRVDII